MIDSRRESSSERDIAKRDPFSTAHLERDLSGRSVRGGAVTVAAQVLKFLLRFATTAVLARLLTPEDFGLIAMTVIATGFIALFKDGGLTQATIQRPQITQAQVSTLFWINAGLGVLAALALLAAAPALAAFYGDARLTAIASVLSISFVLGGLAVQHQALLRRLMRFKHLAAVEVIAMSSGMAIAIGMALSGYGYWALVGQVLTESAVAASCVWLLLRWRPGPPQRGSGIRSMLGFGTDILAFQLVNYMSRHADNLLIGWRWGAAPLGFYEKAYSLLLMPIHQINMPIAAVVVPALSRTQADPPQYRRMFLGALELVTSASVPAVALLVLFAEPIVVLWLGDKWMPVAPLFRYLSVAGLLGAISNCCGWILVSTGRTQRFRNLGLLGAVVVVTAFWLGLPYGPQGVAVAYSAAVLGLFPITWTWTLRDTPISFREFLWTILQPMLAAAIAAAPALLILKQLTTPSPVVQLAVGAAIFISAYAGVYLVAFKKWNRLKMLRKDLWRGPHE